LPNERVFIALGSNLGELEHNLQAALEGIAQLPGTCIVRVSSFLGTAPWGALDQPRFLNAVAEIRTELEPLALLEALKELEGRMGRVPSYRWGPRLIDLDIILYGERKIELPQLQIPHPQYREREFVMAPLREIAPEVIHP
jgi:2-amino-4-hydroxy-6-hydroxymethyldihydropteridine diphosphokinase